MLPSIPYPAGGMAFSSPNMVKRARYNTPSSYADLSSVMFPNKDSISGVGQYGSAGMRTDPTVEFTFKVIPFAKRAWVDEMPQNCLAIVRKQYPTSVSTKGDSNRVCMLALPQLHSLIHEHTLADPHGHDPEAVLNEWKLLGVMITQPPLEGSQGKERAVVVVTKGDLRVINYWGAGIYGGQHLWLVVKKVRIDKETRYLVDAKGMDMVK